MGLILALLLLVGAALALFAIPAAAPILGLSHGAFAGLAFGLALVAGGLGLGWLRPNAASLARAVASAAIWAFLIVGLAEVYANRFEFADIGSRMLEDLLPPETTVGNGGEVIIKGRFGGGYIVPAKVDGRRVDFVFDTGSSSVVLTAEDARRVGLDLAALDFDAPVATANGSSYAAPVRLDKVSVGPIVALNVSALVPRPGAMRESLLGMTFLERLERYGVERGRLVLKAR